MLKPSFALPLAFLLGSVPPLAAQAPAPVTANLTIAFLGDQGLGGDSEAVLQLIHDEGADAVIHAGDFDYRDDPAAWEAQIDAILGPDFPYFASMGNHDERKYFDPGGYQERLEARMNRLGIPWEGDLGVQSSFHFDDILIVFTAPGSLGNGDSIYAPYIRDVLAADDSVWSISAWHKNMRQMQVGGKSDETGWGVYEESRRGGAIIATAHEHSYSRTHLMTDFASQVVASTEAPLVLAPDDPATPEDEGRSFAFVSGLGGQSIRDQEIDGPWWASVYTSTQGAHAGALFGVFNYGGDPNLARFTFKDVTGQIVDDFFVTSSLVPPPPSLRIEDVAVSEGDSGSSEALLRVTLLGATGEEVAVDFTTVDGDAVAGEDYEATSGHLVFSGEVTEQTVSVSIWGDESIEGDESLFVELLAAEGAIVVRPHGEVVIIDDDAPPVPPSLEIATQGSGLVTLEPPGGVYPEGTQVQLTAAAAPGHVFAGWAGDLVGTANPATLLMDRDHQVLARFEAQEPTLLQVESGTAGSAGFVSTAAPLAAVDGDLYLAAIAFKPDVAVTSVSGLGLAWTPVRTQCSGRDQTGLSVWQARGEPTAGGAVTATFSQSPENSVLAVSRYGGVGAVDPVRAVSANSVGIAGACAGGSDGVAYSLDLETATSNSLVYVAAAPRNRDHLPGPGFIERAEIFSGGTGTTAGVSVADTQAGPPGPVAVVGGFSGDTDWAVVAFEIPLAAPFHLAVEPSTGGSVGVDPPYETFVDGAPVRLWALPDEGYRFIGWSGDLSGAQSPTTLVMDSDKTVGATFAPQFRVELSVDNGGSVTLDPPGGQYDEGSIVTLTALPQDGHFFVGWSGDLSGAQNPATLLMDSDRNVGANFSARFTVDALASSGGSVTLDPPGGIYDEGSVVTIHAAPDPDHRFAGWGGALTGLQNPASLLVQSDSIVTAGFVRVFDVSVSPGPGGTITLDPPSGPYDDGSSLKLTAVPDASHRFGSWSGALSGEANPAVLVIETDESVAATFVPQFTLSLTPPVGGYVTTNPPGSRHDVGTAVTLTAFPEVAYSFTGWSGDLGGAQNPTTVVMDSDKSVGARFAPYFLVDVATSFGGSVALDPPGGLYEPGATVTLTATAEPGLAFGGWAGALSGAANPASLVVDRDLAVGAWFVTPVTLQQVESGASGSSTSVSTDGVLAAVEDDLYVASIAVRPDLAVSGVSGLGLTWSPLGSQCAGRGQTGVAVWAARGQPVADGVVTASFSAAPQNSVLAVSRYTSAGLLDLARVASANSVGVAGPCAGGEDQDAYALPLDASTRGSLAVVATAIRNRDHLPGSGYEERIERHKGSGGSVAGLALAERRIDAPGSTAVLGGFSSVVDWAAVAVEVPGAPVPVPEPSEPLMFTSALALLLGLGRSRITRPAASGVVSQSEPIEKS